MTPKQEREKNVKAAFGTAGVCVLVFLVLLLTSAWKTAGSGEGNYPGIEVNLGFDDQGSGNDQPETAPGDPQAKDTENPPLEENSEEEKNIASAEPTPSENVKIVQPTTVTDPNSDVEIKDEKKEVKPEEKVVEKKTTTEPVEKKPEEKPKVVDKNAVYTGKKTTSTGKTPGEGEGKQGSTGNEGDDQNKAGDKGVEGGTPGAAVYKGKPGGGEGGSIEVNGWNYDKIPTVIAPDDQTGRVEFEIQLDENGDLIGYKKLSGSVSPATERECIKAIQKITFTRISTGKVPEVTKGKITFVVVAR
jgi:periplasmic protein TonB